jgi:hypothetical protein
MTGAVLEPYAHWKRELQLASTVIQVSAYSPLEDLDNFCKQFGEARTPEAAGLVAFAEQIAKSMGNETVSLPFQGTRRA